MRKDKRIDWEKELPAELDKVRYFPTRPLEAAPAKYYRRIDKGCEPHPTLQCPRCRSKYIRLMVGDRYWCCDCEKSFMIGEFKARDELLERKLPAASKRRKPWHKRIFT